MPPSQLTTPLVQEQNLQCFASHCRFFFQSSTAICSEHQNATNDGSCQKEGHDHERSLSTSRAVLEAFDRCCNHHAYTDTTIKNTTLSDEASAAIQECGLQQLLIQSTTRDNSEILHAYTLVRDEERKRAHLLQMTKRRNYLCLLLDQMEQREHDKEKFGTNNNANFKSSISLMKSFLKKYKHNIGSHPLLMGMKSLLENQVGKQSRFFWRWTMDGAILTENCHGGEGGGDKYVEDALSTLSSFLVRVNVVAAENEDMEEGKINSSNDVVDDARTMICWEVVPSYSNGQLKKIARLIPSKRNMYGKPTGSLTSTEVKRRNVHHGVGCQILDW
eukprot:CAMPEP_0195524206 /NCGR_PEP_ID=MMETSP0794_2-20130614/23907_1 /TAXON_ID=515487 /ORGANISM="Stephanopyxis turris, Strain CCMP 815" /LENGTH=331 /DNA_ID=CAMNT_0040654381 /DNA_START=54 /DNA_END=1046 /DNA_ORIENTATION=+